MLDRETSSPPWKRRMTSPDTTDIYREPQDFSVDTLNCLGPLAALAGDWQGHSGHDVKPKADGARSQAYEERINLQPIDPQTNGPQLLYGLRYHTHITKPGQRKNRTVRNTPCLTDQCYLKIIVEFSIIHLYIGIYALVYHSILCDFHVK